MDKHFLIKAVECCNPNGYRCKWCVGVDQPGGTHFGICQIAAKGCEFEPLQQTKYKIKPPEVEI